MIDNTLAINSFNNLNVSNLKNTQKSQKDYDIKLKEQTDAFESFMIKEVLDTALKTDESASLFPKSAGSDIYKSMYNDAISRSLSGGFGFSEILYNFLKERG